MIETRLREAIRPDELEVIDDSHLHVGHPGGARTAAATFASGSSAICFTACPGWPGIAAFTRR